MNVETVRSFLLWAGILNYGLLAFWGLLFLFARGWLLRKARWFGLSEETFLSVNYAGIVFYKVSIFLLYLVPYVALGIVT